MHAPEKPHGQLDKLRRTLAMMLGGMLAIVVFTAVALIISRGQALPVLEEAQLAAAKSAWAENGVASYTIAIKVSGMQPALYRVQVEDRMPTSATCNGNPLRDVRTWGTWSVPGMFGTVGRDVETNQRALKSGEPPPLFLRARFDSENGIPRRYLRSDERHHNTTSWEVVEFQVAGDQGAADNEGSP